MKRLIFLFMLSCFLLAGCRNSVSNGNISDRDMDDYNVYVQTKDNDNKKKSSLLLEEDKEAFWGVIKRLEASEKIVLEESQSIDNRNHWRFEIYDKVSKKKHYIYSCIYYENPMYDGGPTVIAVYNRFLTQKVVYRDTDGIYEELSDLAINYYTD